MFSEPITITVNTVAKAMALIMRDGKHSTYQKDDQTFVLDIKHTPFRKEGKDRLRQNVTFSQKAVVPDPLTSVNDYETVSISFQIDRPQVGFTATQIDQMVAGLKTWLDTTNVTKLYGQES